MIVINVETRRATVAERELLTSGSAGIEVQFNFSEDWDGLSRVAVFRYGEDGEGKPAILDDTNIAAIPKAMLVEDGEPIFIGAYGANASGTTVIPTVWASAGVVRVGVRTADIGSMPEDPDSFWVQVLTLADTANSTANAAAETAADAHALATNALTQVSTALDETAGNRQAAETARGLAESARDDAIDAATEARSWAIGNTGSREGEDTDNAKYYAEQAQATLDEAVTEIDTAKAAAITDVQGAGTTQVGLVNSAGTTQIGDVNTAGANQISAVNTAGNTQKNAVTAEGATQVAAVRTEGATQRNTLQPYATQAAASASAAAQSEENAANSATAAAGSATNAASSATAAQTAQTGAEAAQNAAEDAQSAAETAASSVSASAAQIAQNTSDITSLNQAINVFDDIPGTTQTVNFGADGKPSSIIHTSGATTVRSDVFTWTDNTVTEVRTLADGTHITYVTNLDTLVTTISAIEEAS